MKKILTAMFSVVLASFAFAQPGHHPPRAVSSSFEKEYPHSNPSRWTHSAGGWSVEFEDRDHDNGEVTAHFDSRGRHIDTQIPYDEADVPVGVKENLQKRYPGSGQYEYTRIDRAGERSRYKARFMHKKKYRTIYVDEQGDVRQHR
jgi:hypothetical protein